MKLPGSAVRPFCLPSLPSPSIAFLSSSSLTVAIWEWEHDVAFFGSEKDWAAVKMRRMLHSTII